MSIFVRYPADNRASRSQALQRPGRRGGPARATLALLIALLGVSWLFGATSVGGDPLSATGQAVPLQTPTPTLVPGTGTVTGTAWHDLNGNSVWEPAEPPLAGLLVTLQSQDGTTSLSAYTGADGAYRFATLMPGLYTLAATPPPGYRLTTPASFTVFVSAGVVLTLDFGAVFVPTPTPTPTPLPRLDVDSATFAFCGGIIYGDTHAGRNNVSRYACQPAWQEDGPELVYRVELGRSQLLSAWFVTTSVDLDLFLLTSAYPETCLVAGDNYLTYNVQPGVYFLAVDGYQGAAGSFALRLACPYGLQATATPTLTPSPTPTPTATFTPGPTPSPTATSSPRRRYLPLIPHGPPGPTPEPVTLVFQHGVSGYIGATDTTLDAWEPDRAFGDDRLLRLRLNQQTPIITHMAPLLRFDLAPLPVEAYIVRADLKLYLVSAPKYDVRGAARGLLRAWDEDTATWRQPAAGLAWSVEGAQGLGTDHMGWVADEQFIEAAERWYSFDVTQLVRMWVGDPGSNYGLILLAQPGLSQSNVVAGFASREHPDPALRPQLVVSYRIGG